MQGDTVTVALAARPIGLSRSALPEGRETCMLTPPRPEVRQGRRRQITRARGGMGMRIRITGFKGRLVVHATALLPVLALTPSTE